MNKPISPAAVMRGEEHWTEKGSDVRLFLWNKHAGDPSGPAGRSEATGNAAATLLLIHMRHWVRNQLTRPKVSDRAK